MGQHTEMMMQCRYDEAALRPKLEETRLPEFCNLKTFAEGGTLTPEDKQALVSF